MRHGRLTVRCASSLATLVAAFFPPVCFFCPHRPGPVCVRSRHAAERCGWIDRARRSSGKKGRPPRLPAGAALPLCRLRRRPPIKTSRALRKARRPPGHKGRVPRSGERAGRAICRLKALLGSGFDTDGGLSRAKASRMPRWSHEHFWWASTFFAKKSCNYP